MSRLSAEAIKEQLVQAIFDVLDEMESDITHNMTTQKEAETIADAVFNVITETDDEDLSIAEMFPGDDEVIEDNETAQ